MDVLAICGSPRKNRTTHAALQAAAAQLRDTLSYPLLVQGELQRNELLQQFIRVDTPVLLGTSSFWEGVDVRGEALVCVLIDKLPFAGGHVRISENSASAVSASAIWHLKANCRVLLNRAGNVQTALVYRLKIQKTF